jgi:hypothetical protein
MKLISRGRIQDANSNSQRWHSQRIGLREEKRHADGFTKKTQPKPYSFRYVALLWSHWKTPRAKRLEKGVGAHAPGGQERGQDRCRYSSAGRAEKSFGNGFQTAIRHRYGASYRQRSTKRQSDRVRIQSRSQIFRRLHRRIGHV